MAAVTKLLIDGIDVTPYAARGLSQSYEWIEGARFFPRTINGVLKDLSDTNFRKIRTEITCTDIDAPGEHFLGLDVTVECSFELNYQREVGDTTGSAAQHDVVDGSVRLDGLTLYYRPAFDGKVVDFNFSNDEFDRANGWTMIVEEI